jgi:succinyl-CoA synthetase alpha subunit
MAVLIHADTKVITQGITGDAGKFHTLQSVAYGTAMVGGVTPGKGGQTVAVDGGEAIPVFDTVRDAVAATGAKASHKLGVKARMTVRIVLILFIALFMFEVMRREFGTEADAQLSFRSIQGGTEARCDEKSYLESRSWKRLASG